MKKGFVFIETLIVLILLSVTVVGTYSMYYHVAKNIEERKYYDNIDDLYKTEILRSITNTNMLSSTNNILEINSSNCTNYMNSDCGIIMTALEAEKIYINFDTINNIINNDTNGIKNSMRSYLGTISNNTYDRYIIVNYKYNNNNYYASLKI